MRSAAQAEQWMLNIVRAAAWARGGGSAPPSIMESATVPEAFYVWPLVRSPVVCAALTKWEG